MDKLIERLRQALLSAAFFHTQPDRGDVFDWLDDNIGKLFAEPVVQAALAALTAARDESPREADGWQPIETHSGDSCPVDLWLVIAPSARSMGWGDSFRVADAWRRGGGWVHLQGNECKEIEAGYITHWRPLPPPPSTDGEVG